MESPFWKGGGGNILLAFFWLRPVVSDCLFIHFFLVSEFGLFFKFIMVFPSLNFL